jgi:hypothetical protein
VDDVLDHVVVCLLTARVEILVSGGLFVGLPEVLRIVVGLCGVEK